MIPSEDNGLHAQAILADVRAQLEESHITRMIDGPIEEATERFRCPDAPAQSQRELLDHAAAFLRHVHATAFPSGRQLPPSSARAEAVRLLETGYQGGFRGAVWEATRSDGPGIPSVVAEMAGLLRGQLRDSYVRWIIASQLERADWPTRCQMASIIMSEWGDRRPSDLTAGSAEQFANFLPHVLFYDQSLRSHSLASALANSPTAP